jgi:membrane associated rhomboid family serine protease
MDTVSERQRLRTCRSCGTLTPLATRWCVNCGVADDAPDETRVVDSDEQRFAEAFFGRATRATVTLLVVNIAFLAAIALSSGALITPTNPFVVALVNYGAAVKYFIAQGEYWRLVTEMFLHVGAIHLAFNGFALYMVGTQVEKLYGAARFVVIYFLSGLAGSVASYLAPTFGGPSAGASGAIFGLFGALFVFGIRFRKELPGVFGRAFGFQVLPTILLNLLITFAIPFIDKGAHIGGLLGGMALAAVMPYARPGERRASLVWRALATLCVGVVIWSFVLAYQAPKHTFESLYVPGILVDESDSEQRFRYYFDRSHTALNQTVDSTFAASKGERYASNAVDVAVMGANDARSGRGFDARADELLERQAVLLERMARTLASAKVGRLEPGDVNLEIEYFSQLERDWEAWFVAEGYQKLGIEPPTQDPSGPIP